MLPDHSSYCCGWQVLQATGSSRSMGAALLPQPAAANIKSGAQASEALAGGRAAIVRF